MEKKKDKIQDEDLASAKRDLLMRFIKDQESLQTRQTDLKPSNDTTLDILDRLAVSKELSQNQHNKGRGDLKSTLEQNEHVSKIRMLDEVGALKRKDVSCRIMSSRTRGPMQCLREEMCDPVNVTVGNQNLEAKEERIRLCSTTKLESILHPTERRWSDESQRRLRSAPALSFGEDAGQFLRHGEINVIEARNLKSRKLSSLSIVVPTETERGIKQDSTRSCIKHPITCTHISRPLNGSSMTMSIPSVDVQLLDGRTVSSLTGQLAVFHLPPIAPETSGTQPSTK